MQAALPRPPPPTLVLVLSSINVQQNLQIFYFFVAGLEDGRLDSQHMSGLYGHRSNSSASSSPPAGLGQSGQGQDGGLVVPQPINAKHHGGHHANGGGGGGSGRKYQCKMCPQVGKVSDTQKINKGPYS